MINGSAFAAAGLSPSPLSRLHPAVRLGGLLLGLVTCMVAGPVLLAAMLVALIVAMLGTGLDAGHQWRALRPWAAVGILVVLVHTFTSTWAAPLGRPSAAGFLAGLGALGRVICSVAWLGLYLRVTPLDDLVVGAGWWLGPLQKLGLPTADLPLMLAVALGTAPAVLGEGRRIEAVVRLRRTGPAGAAPPAPGRLRRWRRDLTDRARVVVPLLESLVRRAEALSLSLRHRRPDPALGRRPVPVLQLGALVLWLAFVIWTVAAAGRPVAP